MTAAGTDWSVDRVVSVTDGDTVRLVRRRQLGVLDGLALDAYDAEPKGVPIRLVTLDTPEHGEKGWAEARADIIEWTTSRYLLHGLRVETWPGGGFDRLLGDIYVAGDRSNTLSEWMLRERGWLPYVRGV